MWVMAVRAELRIPDERSLKGKRRVLRPHLERLRRMASLSVAEVGHQDAWQRATIGVAAVARSRSELESLMDSVRRYLDSQPDIELMDLTMTPLGIDDD